MLRYTSGDDDIIRKSIYKLNYLQNVKLADCLETLISTVKLNRKNLNGLCKLSKEDSEKMVKAVSGECESIDTDEW